MHFEWPELGCPEVATDLGRQAKELPLVKCAYECDEVVFVVDVKYKKGC